MANLTLRRSIETLELTAGGLDALRDAYTKMQNLSATDNRSWIYLAGIHGFPQYMCWHHGRIGMGNRSMPYDLFLPWHRAFLLYFEHSMRDHNANAALPWWDWSSDSAHLVGVPNSFSVPRIGAVDNSLYDGPRPAIPPDPPRRTVRFPGRPARLPTKAQVSSVLGLNQFVDFSDQLEDFHDGVHGWTGGSNPNPPPRGGDMGSVATSAFDPIFWSHHCMLDRLWYIWQLMHGIHNIPPDYLDKPLAPFALKVSDVLDIHALGYEYADASTS